MRKSLTFLSGLGYVELARTLVERGVNLRVPDKNGSTPLHLALDKGHFELAYILVKHGADPRDPDQNGFRPHCIERWTGHNLN
jgi:ankyrin repeat protein